MGSSPKTHLSSSTGASGGVPLKRVKDENFYQNARDARRLKLLTGGKPIRDKRGLNIQAAEHPKGENDTESGRVAHDRRWFGNTQVVSQTTLYHFHTSLSMRKYDPYSILLRQYQPPTALLDDAADPNMCKANHRHPGT